MNKIAALLLALTAAFSFSQENAEYDDRDNLEERIDELEYSLDTLKGKFISDNFISVKAAKEIQELHNNVFEKMQNSFYFFIVAIGIFISVLSFVNFKSLDRSKEEFKTINTNFSDLEIKLNEQIEKQKGEFGKMKIEFEEEKNILEKNRKDLYGEIEYTYFSLAITNFKMEFYEEHFNNLAEHFATFRKRNIRPENIDLKRLAHFNDFIKKYNDIEIAKIFLCELDKFIKYSEEMYTDTIKIESIFLEKIKEIWQKLCEKFGGQDKITEAIKDFKSHL